MISEHPASVLKLLTQLDPERTAPLVMAEIGVAGGVTSALVFRNFPNVMMWLIDPYEDYQRQSADAMRQLLTLALVNTQVYRDRRRFLVMPSVDAAELMPDGSLDLVFIDGDHTYHAVRSDLNAWWPKLKGTGGIMCGDDYRPKLPGVKKAVDEWAQQNGHEIGFLPTSVWWTTKRETKS